MSMDKLHSSGAGQLENKIPASEAGSRSGLPVWSVTNRKSGYLQGFT